MDALLNRIVQFCKGDKVRAKKLVEASMQQYPGQSSLWYLQKVISDLEQEQAAAFRQRKKLQPVATAKSSPKHQPKPQLTNSVDPLQMNQLLNLMRGDREAVDRLMELTRKRNPNRCDQWVLEKVIYDLERDRRC